MLRARDRRVQIALAVGLLVAIGIAGYQIGVIVWTSRQYDAACQALARYDYAQAMDHLERFLSVCPTDQAALLLAAQTSRRQGSFEEAARKLRLAQEHGAAPDALAVEMQLLRLQAGDLTDADHLARFCNHSPDGPEATLILEALVEGSFRALNFSLAKWGIELWLQHHPGKFDQAHGLDWHGRVSEYNKDLPQARADYQQAIALAPEYWPARMRLAEAWLRDDPRQAIPHLESLCRDRPDDPAVCLLKARWYRSMGQPEEAAKLLDRILVAAPDNVPVLVERGRVALDQNQAADAERWLKHALSLAPEMREVNLAVADCLRQAGRLDEAKRYQEKAREVQANLRKRLEESNHGEENKKSAYLSGVR